MDPRSATSATAFDEATRQTATVKRRAIQQIAASPDKGIAAGP